LTKFDIWAFWKIGGENWSSTKIRKVTGTLYKDIFTFMTISPSIFLRMRNVSYKSCRENQNTHPYFQ
jgi:hypothetical protein